ncbi:MAG: hypothetical protein ACI9XP_001062 [Lentimonas sp.]|jgi:hypothetical protein
MGNRLFIVGPFSCKGNTFATFKSRPLFNQQYKLAELNIEHQINNILNSYILGTCFAEFDAEDKGLTTSKKVKLYKEILIKKNNRIHEL